MSFPVRGAREVPEEHVVVGCVRLDARARDRAVAERAVRLEERVAQQDVLVVFVAENAVLRRDEALHAGPLMPHSGERPSSSLV